MHHRMKHAGSSGACGFGRAKTSTSNIRSSLQAVSVDVTTIATTMHASPAPPRAESHAKTAIVGLGDPVMDVIVAVSPDFLSSIAERPGGCVPVSGDEMEALISRCSQHSDLLRIPGGSAANVMKGLANMLDHDRAASIRFVGMIGSDATGEEYQTKLAAQKVRPLLQRSDSGAPSATSLCLVTPDGQRTMRTCLGASLELQSASMVPPAWADNCALLHCEGYCLYRPHLAAEMMRAAKKAGALVSMDLASFELVANCRQALMALLEEGLLDLVFANEEEAVALWQQLDSSSNSSSSSSSTAGAGGAEGAAAAAGSTEQGPAAEAAAAGSGTAYEGSAASTTQQQQQDAALREVHAAQNFLLKYCQVSVVSLGVRGCVAKSREGAYGMAPACLVDVKDTIGAGDYFTSGFLYAYLQGASLQQCAVCGCAAGAEAVQAVGAELSEEAYERLRQQVQHTVGVAAN